jgi:membrane-associated phospholipid phosphatase
LIALAIVVTAAITRGTRRAVAAALLLSGAAVTTQLLKPALAHARFDRDVVGFHHFIDPVIPSQAFPSGHATAAMSIALALVIVAPRAWRPVAAAIGAVFTLAVSFSIVTLGWHYPSDVIGGYLVALIWCLTLIAATRLADERWPEPGTIRAATRRAIDARDTLRAVAVTAVAATAVVAAVGLSKLDRVAHFAEHHTATTLAAMAISASAAAVVAGVAVAASRRP